jgi:hypothetical protein
MLPSAECGGCRANASVARFRLGRLNAVLKVLEETDLIVAGREDDSME